MSLHTFDKLSGAALFFILGFSFGVALASWNWFPTEGDWGHIAEIPEKMLNFTALLLPFIMLLSYLLLQASLF